MILAAYMILAAALSAGLYLFFTLKVELRSAERRHDKRIDEIAERLRQAEEPLEALGAQESSVVAYPLRSGFNLNKRVHAMRLLRRGEDVAHVAAVLGVPRREVELLIRVQQMARTPQANAVAAGAGDSTTLSKTTPANPRGSRSASGSIN